MLSGTQRRWCFVGIFNEFISHSYPNLKTVRELVYKRGFGVIDRKRIPLDDNALIEKSLGTHGLICMEDLVHEIATVGPHFREANRFLWPFQLNTARGGLSMVRRHFAEGGDYGNREEKINALISRMV